MKIKMGRFFSPEFPSDSSAVVLNESAITNLDLRKIHWAEKLQPLQVITRMDHLILTQFALTRWSVLLKIFTLNR